MNVSDAVGAQLDWMVAKCEGLNPNSDPKVRRQYVGYSGFAEANGFGYAIKHYSTDWSQGGPLLEREKLELRCTDYEWQAFCFGFPVAKAHSGRRVWASGPTPLIAAMRCLVASHLGDEVDVPDELK